MNQEIKYNSCKPYQIVLYPFTEAVQNLFLVVMMFASYVAAGGYGIAVATAGLIATGSRILDGITDPIIALVIDKFNTKFGKVRILLALGYFIAGGSIYLMFFVGPGSGIFVFTALYCVYIIGYTIIGIAKQVANAIMTNDPKQRPLIFRWSTIYTTVLSSSVGIYIAKVLYPKYGGLTIEAFQEMALTAIIGGGVLMALSIIAIGKKDNAEVFNEVKASKPVSLKEGIELVRKNNALKSFIFAATSDKLALQAASNTAIATIIFGIIIGNYRFNGTLTFYNIIVSIVFILFATKTAVKGGAKKSLIRWTTLSIVISFGVIAFMMIVDPTQISVATIITVAFVLLNAMYAASKVATSACTGAMVPDIIDYEYSRSGNYMPATVGAIYSFIDKMISSLATTIVGFCLAGIGYVDAMPQPGDPSSPTIFWMGMFLWMGLPIIGWVCTLIAMKFYPLDQEKMVEVQRINQEQRQATAAAAASI